MMLFKKVKKQTGRRHIYFCGIKVFSYKKKKGLSKIKITASKWAKFSKNKKEKILKKWYFSAMGEKLNLDNPQTFNEKMQWLKLYDSTPLKTLLADKYLVRDWVREKIGEKYLVPLLGVWDKFDEIDFDKLPNQFVLKCNHGSSYNIIVTDKSKLNLKWAKERIDGWMNEDYAFKEGFELHYSSIPRKIIAEVFICNNNEEIADYKCWCFNGKFLYIQHISDRTVDKKMAFFNKNWEKQGFITNDVLNEARIEKPRKLSEMILLAEKLSEGFSFCRVDFYVLSDGNLKFGEMTFVPCSGKCHWNDNNMNNKLGKLIKTNKSGQA